MSGFLSTKGKTLPSANVTFIAVKKSSAQNRDKFELQDTNKLQNEDIQSKRQYLTLQGS